MKLKSTFVAALLAAASVSSFAAITFDDPLLGTAHLDATTAFADFTLAYSFDGLIAGQQYDVNLSILSDGIKWTSGNLDGHAIIFGTSTGNLFTSLDYTGLAPLKLTLVGSGVNKNANFGADITVSAVPEPETYAMLLAGLGLMGTIARRRSQKQVA